MVVTTDPVGRETGGGMSESGSLGRWTIDALDTGTSTLDGSMLTYTVGVGEPVTIPRVMWVIRGATTVVVDTSVPTGGRASEFIGEVLERRPEQEPANALHLAGVDPKDVETVVLTHLHWDHAGNCDLFPDARILVQESELRYAIAPGRFFRKAFLSPQSGWGIPPYLLPNLQTVRGPQELAPGLRLVPAPGHTPGSQALVVDTEHGSFCIAGDAISTYRNIDDDLPPGYHVDVDASMDSMDTLRATADHLLPSHDYGVFSDGPVTRIGTAHGADRQRGA
jgi:N-acyl homoserine lactone hydrolase